MNEVEISPAVGDTVERPFDEVASQGCLAPADESPDAAGVVPAALARAKVPMVARLALQLIHLHVLCRPTTQFRSRAGGRGDIPRSAVMPARSVCMIILLTASCREYPQLGNREEVFRSAEARPLAADRPPASEPALVPSGGADLPSPAPAPADLCRTALAATAPSSRFFSHVPRSRCHHKLLLQRHRRAASAGGSTPPALAAMPPSSAATSGPPPPNAPPPSPSPAPPGGASASTTSPGGTGRWPSPSASMRRDRMPTTCGTPSRRGAGPLPGRPAARPLGHGPSPAATPTAPRTAGPPKPAAHNPAPRGPRRGAPRPHRMAGQ